MNSKFCIQTHKFSHSHNCQVLLTFSLSTCSHTCNHLTAVFCLAFCLLLEEDIHLLMGTYFPDTPFGFHFLIFGASHQLIYIVPSITFQLPPAVESISTTTHPLFGQSQSDVFTLNSKQDPERLSKYFIDKMYIIEAKGRRECDRSYCSEEVQETELLLQSLFTHTSEYHFLSQVEIPGFTGILHVLNIKPPAQT